MITEKKRNHPPLPFGGYNIFKGTKYHRSRLILKVSYTFPIPNNAQVKQLQLLLDMLFIYLRGIKLFLPTSKDAHYICQIVHLLKK